MNKIRYYKDGRNIAVYLDNKRTGTIRAVKGGYAYFIFQTEDHGEVFDSIQKVKDSLEAE
jgi:hypothetical protein